MKQEIVLPKFKLPGQGPSWPMRALWVAGGLVGLQVAVLGMALSKKQAAQEAALAAAQVPQAPARSLGIRAASAAAAAQPRPSSGAPEAATASTVAEAPASSARAEASSAPTAAAAKVEADRPARSGKRASVKGRRASSSRGGKMLAKATTTRNGAEARKSASKDSTVDDLLRRFK